MASGSAGADPCARRPVPWLAKGRRWQRRGSCSCLSPLEMRPPGHGGIQLPRLPAPISSRLGASQAFSPLGFVATGHPGPAVGLLPGAPAWSLRPSLHLLSHAILGDFFPNSVPEEAPGCFYRGHGGEILPGPSLQTPTAIGSPPPSARCSAEALLPPGTPPAFPALH